MKSFAQIKAIEKKNKQKWLEICPTLNENSGIYILTREENGFKFGYIGQAKHLLTRLAQHLMGYEQHIDKSLRRHKLWSKDNPTGWGVDFVECPESELNQKEQEYIKEYANLGYQLRNKTSGSQDGDKYGINENGGGKGYREGVVYGYKKAQKEVAHLFEKNLCVGVVKENKTNFKALEKFKQFIGGQGID